MKKRILPILFAITMMTSLQIGALATSVYNADEKGTVIKIENDDERYKVGYLESIPIEVDEQNVSSMYIPWGYSAGTPEVVSFFDYNSKYNIVHPRYDEERNMTGIAIKRYGVSMNNFPHQMEALFPNNHLRSKYLPHNL